MAALPALATVEDLADWVDETIADDNRRALAVLRHASSRVRTIAGKTWLNEDEDAVEDVPEDIVGVVVAAAGRAWTNPNGTQSHTIDDYTERFFESQPLGVELTEEEKEICRRYNPAGSSGLWTQTTTRWDGDAPDDYAPVEYDGKPIYIGSPWW